jgi:hypothetical protein
MRAKAQAITLRDKSFKIRPLTLGQVMRLEEVVANPNQKYGTEYGVSVIRIGLLRDHPKEAEAISDIEEYEITAAEIGKASSTILRLGGYLPPEDSDMGEAEPLKGASE